MVETITETVFSQLSGALASLDALAQTYFAVQEENERVARFSKFDPNQAAFIAAFDKCAGDTVKLKELQDSRRIGIIELEIRAFNLSELERQVDASAYTVKQLIRKALDYYDKHRPRSFDTALSADMAIVIKAVQTIQSINHKNSLRRLTTSQWHKCRNSEECQAVVKNTLSRLSQTIKELTGANRHYQPQAQDSVFDSSAYPCTKTEVDSDFRFSRNWHHHYQRLLQVSVLPTNIELTAPGCLALMQACSQVKSAEANLATALEELLQRLRATDLKPNRLTLALQTASSDEAIAAVARDRLKITHENRYEYSAFMALLSAALQLRDARVSAAQCMVQALSEVEELGIKPRYDVPKSDHHFVCGVYLLYCADLLLRRSGQNLHSISGNTAFMERYQVMQNDLHSLIAEVSTFARKQMF
ncbi:MAG: hypothetical protein IPP97_12240 [Candidatus Obscuribacter sp.]|nr:hypothetical protein [Candidatus Obscuribacter sp.]